MRRLLIILQLVILSLSAEARVFYVKTGGNDLAAGTSDATAWGTLTKINATAFLPGDSILFNRGDTWRGTITVDNGNSSARVYYGAYGTGNKPRLQNSVNALSGWTDLGSNIWQNTNAAFTRRVGNLIFNNEASIGINKYTEAELAAQGDFWHDYTNNLVKIYSVGNPGSYYTAIEACLSGQTVSLNHNSYITFENLDFRYSGEGTIYAFYCHDMTVRSCDFRFNGGCFWHPAENDTRLGGGTGCWGGTGGDVYNMLFEKNYLYNEYDGALSASGGDGTYSMYNIIFKNNVVSHCELTYEYWVGAGATAHDIYFEHNTAINAGGNWTHTQRTDSPRGQHIAVYTSLANEWNIVIRNNIFCGATERMIYFEVTADANDITIDYNLYYLGSAPSFGRISSNNYTTLSSWLASPYLDDQDLNSNLAYPEFLSATDFHLQSSSPAIGMGIVSSRVPTDFDDVQFGIPPSVGAYEHNSSTPPVPSGDGILGKDRTGTMLKDKNGKIIIL